MPSRRTFIRNTAITAVGFVGLRALVGRNLLGANRLPEAGYGPLFDDTQGLLKIPRGFSYTVFSPTGEEMVDGFLVPAAHDGMCAFPGPEGKTLLVRNHELTSRHPETGPFGIDNARLARIPEGRIYDRGYGTAPTLGGTTTLVFDTQTQKMESHFLSLTGTQRNCAGGPTPWGTWVTCEEIESKPEPGAEQIHGYNFEVKPSSEPGLVDPVPLKAMGRFRHEAIAIDPQSGAVYQTEDYGDGLLYRFLPDERSNLAAGGRLQALAMVDPNLTDTRNWPGSQVQFPIGRGLPVRWVDLDDPESPADDLRIRGSAKGAVPFGRGEGAWTTDSGIYFAMTTGGQKLMGQIFRYIPGPYEGTTREAEQPGRLELYAEPNDSELLLNCDNLTVAPWGDLVICEDHSGKCRLIGVTPAGQYYVIAENNLPKNELAGACFSPDGSTLFCNVQRPGYTVAITGPWAKRAHA